MEIHKAKPLGFKTITLGDFIRSFDVFHNCIHKINIYEYKTCKFLGEIKKYFSPEKSYYYTNNPLLFQRKVVPNRTHFNIDSNVEYNYEYSLNIVVK